MEEGWWQAEAQHFVTTLSKYSRGGIKNFCFIYSLTEQVMF